MKVSLRKLRLTLRRLRVPRAPVFVSHFLPGFVGGLGVLVYAGPSGLIEDHVAWRNREVRVCWATPEMKPPRDVRSSEIQPWPADSRAYVQSVVQAEYTEGRTGIHFEGWSSCADEPGAVPIFTSMTAQSGLSSEGEGGYPTRDDGFHERRRIAPFVFLVGGSLENSDLKRVMTYQPIHEFGHLAGLRHEHARAEARMDPRCDDPDLKRFLDEPTGPTAKFAGPYDPSSIMSYCHLKSLKSYGRKFYRPLKTPNGAESAALGLAPAADFAALDGYSTLPVALADFDESLITNREAVGPYEKFELHVGLSAGDVRALRMLYPANVQANLK